jgi:hypothetical protein
MPIVSNKSSLTSMPVYVAFLVEVLLHFIGVQAPASTILLCFDIIFCSTGWAFVQYSALCDQRERMTMLQEVQCTWTIKRTFWNCSLLTK